MAGACLFLPLGAQPGPTIRVPVRLVNVPTLVFGADGRLVAGLAARDFRVFDNDRPQKIRLDTEPLPVSVALVVQANQGVRSYLP